MQPTYMPWLGYFELMSNCDLFVFLDDVQFIGKSWHSRNRIKAVNGELFLAVPVLSKGNRFKNINEIMINNSINWRKKHFTSIKYNYKKASFFNDYIDALEDVYKRDYNMLLEFNLAVIEFLRQSMGIKTQTVLSSQIGAEGARDERIINICKKLNADVLYDAAGAKEILDPGLFKDNGIELIFQEYHHPVYAQLHGDFIPYLSAIDLLLNEGKRSLEITLSGAI